MSNPHLPQELLDHIVNLLHDTKHALRNCCLVSKSWIPRTRKHLFTDIRFYIEKDLRLWKETFPDPSTSPAHYAKTLVIGCSHLVTTADAEPGGWITGFSGVVNLEMANHRIPSRALADGFAPFQGFSSTIKSLRMDFLYLPSPQSSDLILSFPLLEDLIVFVYGEVVTHEGDGSDEPSTIIQRQPSSSPSFAGSLELSLEGGMKPIACRLLSLPGGIHFRRLTLDWRHEEDRMLATALVEECSHTLESLDITHIIYSRFGSTSASVDLSKATRLKDVIFRPKSRGADWITTALQTITPRHQDLRQISIHMPNALSLPDVDTDVGRIIREETCRQWSGPDRLMVKFWELRSIRPRIVYATPKEVTQSACVRDRIGHFLPEITGRGIVDFVEY